jgi:anti-anti-sigma factor
MGLRISARKFEDITILDVHDRIVIGETCDSFGVVLCELAESKPCNVLVNFAEATQVDSSRISALVKSFVTLKRHGGNVNILNPLGAVRDLLDVTGLVHCLQTYTDGAKALASIHDGAAHA